MEAGATSNGNASASRSVHDAIGAALHTAEASGIDRRHFRTGLWHATMSVVIDAAEPEDLAEILEDRISTIRGYGHNPDSPLQALSDADSDIRKTASAAVAEIVLSYVNPLIEALDRRDEDGITPLLDTVLQTLAEAWGPHHLRRIMTDQVTALRDGHLAPVMPVEPAQMNRAKSQPARVRTPDLPPPVQVTETAEQPAPPAIQPVEPRRRVPPARAVSVHILAEVAWDGSGIYGIAMAISHPGTDRTEIREIAGGCDARGNPRVAYLAACADALSSLGEPSPDEPVTFVTGPDFLPPSIENPARSPWEEGFRNRLDELATGRNVTWITGRGGIGTDLAERTDRLFRHRSQETERLRRA